MAVDWKLSKGEGEEPSGWKSRNFLFTFKNLLFESVELAWDGIFFYKTKTFCQNSKVFSLLCAAQQWILSCPHLSWSPCKFNIALLLLFVDLDSTFVVMLARVLSEAHWKFIRRRRKIYMKISILQNFSILIQFHIFYTFHPARLSFFSYCCLCTQLGGRIAILCWPTLSVIAVWYASTRKNSEWWINFRKLKIVLCGELWICENWTMSTNSRGIIKLLSDSWK